MIALVLISIVLVLSLKSLQMGLISIVPNLLPGMAGFGVWYLIEGRVGLSTSMVLGITMGIVVDDIGVSANVLNLWLLAVPIGKVFDPIQIVWV